jgi:catechol 2,3-dioxygenase-like lactoylglutathione lyase family enzyme
VLSYVYFGTNDLERAIGFYNATLGALGMRRVVTNDPAWDRVAAGWGMYEDDGQRELAFWIGKPFDGKPATVGNGSMAAFRARSWQEVDDFHAAALAHGGTVGRRAGFAPALQPRFLCSVRARSGRQQARALCRGFTARQ